MGNKIYILKSANSNFGKTVLDNIEQIAKNKEVGEPLLKDIVDNSKKENIVIMDPDIVSKFKKGDKVIHCGNTITMDEQKIDGLKYSLYNNASYFIDKENNDLKINMILYKDCKDKRFLGLSNKNVKNIYNNLSKNDLCLL